MGQALYRKYRSKSLEELVGQEHITKTLAQGIAAGRISHAYLFTGPRGVGKTSVARILAHQINQLPYTNTPHLDIIEIDAASNRRIDDIRDLRDKVHMAPVSAAYKVYIIDEVHMLTQESFNALLKTLEEPPAHVVFILATTEVHKLPATIISRTQRFSFRPVTKDKVIAHLRHIAAQEGITINDEALQLIAEYGEGSFRDSISLLDQLTNTTEDGITAQTIEQSLGLAPQAIVNDIVQALIRKDTAALNALLKTLSDQGITTTAIVHQLLQTLGDAAPQNPWLYNVLDGLLEVPRAYNPHIKLLTTLLRATLPSSSQTAPVAAAEPPKKQRAAVVAPVPPPLTISRPALSMVTPKAESITEEAAFTGAELSEFTAEGWGQTLAALRTANAPLHAIVSQAQPHFNASSQVLALTFRYQLHSKKMDDMKNKNILAQIMQQVLGGAPTIQCQVDTTATAPVVAPEPPTPVAAPSEVLAQTPSDANPTAQSVIDLMGGGEVVHAS